MDLADGLDYRKVKVSVPEGAPLTANVSQEANGTAFLSVHWRGGVQPGWYHHRIDLHYPDLPRHPAMFLQFAAQVVPPIDVFPPSLFITDEELAGTWSRQLVLQGRGVKVESLPVAWSDPQTERFYKVEKTITQHGFILTVKPKAAGVTAGRLELFVGPRDHPLCTIPVFLGQSGFSPVNKKPVGRVD